VHEGWQRVADAVEKLGEAAHRTSEGRMPAVHFLSITIHSVSKSCNMKIVS
jgi:hypothetical protein